MSRARYAAGIAVLSLLAGACRSELDPGARRSTSTTTRELTPAPGALALPLRDGSVRFAVIGDAGRGDQPQLEIAGQMAAWHAKFPFDLVLMLGDNIYGPHTPRDYELKFEVPYRALLDAGVTFQAAIGNHDDSGEINYAGFNMGGRRYYTFRRSEHRLAGLAGAGARFFALDSRGFDSEQLAWFDRELAASATMWKIAYFHHPIYTSGRYTASAWSLRRVIEPILVKGDVDVVLSGHEHFYERIHPQHGITYFVSGAAGSLRAGDIQRSRLTAKGFDADYSFMLMEITGDELYFQAISRTGQTVDAGVISRQTTTR